MGGLLTIYVIGKVALASRGPESQDQNRNHADIVAKFGRFVKNIGALFP
jgi:uncharacterized protein (DUF924 family)